MGLEASVRFEEEPVLGADGEFEDGVVELLDEDSPESALEAVEESIPPRREDSVGAQRTLDATQLYLSEIGFSPLLTAGSRCST
jgi:hypothetical protein